MIVRQFLQWVRNARPGDRADATSALARAYLHSDLSPDDLAAAEGALIMLLDDPSPLVRRALAEVFASSQKAPQVVVNALANDQADVAVPVLARSPLLLDSDLVDLVATGEAETQAAIASRPLLPRPVGAAIAEVGGAQACLVLLENADADVTPASIDRIVERFGHLAAIRETLLSRPDISAPTRQALLTKLTETLTGYVAARRWLTPDHAQYAAKDSYERATVTLAAEARYEEIAALVQHLRESGHLTPGLILRALLSGNIVMFEEAMAELAGIPIDRVSSYIHDRNISGFRALYRKSGLPDIAYPAFREALAALRGGVLIGEPGGVARLKRRMVEHVLARCEQELTGEIEPLLTLLRRFAVEAAREEARMFCDDLVAAPLPVPVNDDHGRLVA